MRITGLRAAVAVQCLLLVPPSSFADYRAGIEAYRSGDYGLALTEWREVGELPPGTVDPAIRAEASYALGMLYWLGQGVVQDSTQAARWLAQAADSGHAGAQSKLGYLYLVGQGVPQNDFEALKWLRMAAHQGDADAQYNLGVMYRDGQGITASSERALEWFSEAAANGDGMAVRVIQEYERTGVLEKVTSPPAATESPPSTAGSSSGTASADAAQDASRPSPAQKVATFRKEPETPAPAAVAPDWPETVEDEAWIESRDPARYTIQVIAVRQVGRVQEFIERHPELAPFAVFRQGPTGAPLWALIQGDYASAAEAKSAWQQFPAEIQPRENLWIRPFGDVQALLR